MNTIDSMALQFEQEYQEGEKVKIKKTNFTNLRTDLTDEKVASLGKAIVKLMDTAPERMYTIKRERLVEQGA